MQDGNTSVGEKAIKQRQEKRPKIDHVRERDYLFLTSSCIVVDF
jgi:hypothetical protein